MSGAGTEDGGRISALFPQGKIARIPAAATALVLAFDDFKLNARIVDAGPASPKSREPMRFCCPRINLV